MDEPLPDLQTPLILATRHGHAGVARALIEGGARLDVSDRLERTPLVWAEMGAVPELIKVLRDAGAASSPAKRSRPTE